MASTKDSYTLHRQARKRFPRNRYLVTNLDELWQADLNYLRSLSKYNDERKYILTVIDVFSKYVWSRALSDKTGAQVTEAFEDIFKGCQRKPRALQYDRVKEFSNKTFQTFLENHGVHFYVSKDPVTKVSVVERFNRTLKSKMWQMFTSTSSFRYVDALPQQMQSYNTTVHRSIRMAPVDVNDTNILTVWRNIYGTAIRHTADVKP